MLDSLIELLMCALYYQWCLLLRQPSSQVNCCLASGELCSRCFKANSLLTLPAVWNSGASVPRVDYVGGRQRKMGQRRKQSLPYMRKAWWSLLTAETCVYSWQSLGGAARASEGQDRCETRETVPRATGLLCEWRSLQLKESPETTTTFKVLWQL